MPPRTKTPPDGRELVDKHFPYDGPHSDEAVLQAAKALDQLARYIANATGPGNGKHTLTCGADVYRVLGQMNGALASIEQVLVQLGDAAKRTAADPLAYDDRRDRPASQTAGELVAELTAARKLLFQPWPDSDHEANTVHSHVAAAHIHSAHLGYDG
jgi:hypothetical protein